MQVNCNVINKVQILMSKPPILFIEMVKLKLFSNPKLF